MKPRIRAYSENYELWVGYAWLALELNLENNTLRQAQREHNYKLSKMIEGAALGPPRFKVNTDVMIPYCINPKTGITKYIKAL